MTGFCGGGCLGWIPLSYIDPGRLILASWSKWSALGSTNTLTLTVFKPFLELMLTNEMCSTHDIMIKNFKNVIASDVFLINFLLWMFRQGECFICVFLCLISERIKTPLPPPLPIWRILLIHPYHVPKNIQWIIRSQLMHNCFDNCRLIQCSR